jgi:hypothetical protein
VISAHTNTNCPISDTVRIIIFVNLDVQSADSPTLVTEVTGRDMISGAGLCSMKGYIHICITNVKVTTKFKFVWGGGTSAGKV